MLKTELYLHKFLISVPMFNVLSVIISINTKYNIAILYVLNIIDIATLELCKQTDCNQRIGIYASA